MEYGNFGIAPSGGMIHCSQVEMVRMPRRPQKTGGLLLKRRGYMTHAGLAVMAVAARLGPA